jgi:hypothetical protein
MLAIPDLGIVAAEVRLDRQTVHARKLCRTLWIPVTPAERLQTGKQGDLRIERHPLSEVVFEAGPAFLMRDPPAQIADFLVQFWSLVVPPPMNGGPRFAR